MSRHKYGERNRGAKGKAKEGNEKETGEGGSQASVRFPISASMVLCMCAPGDPGCHETHRQCWFPPDTKVC